MDCPICNLENPEHARRCPCGYDFESGNVVVPQRYMMLRLTAALLRLAGWLALLAGIVLLVVFAINHFGYVIRDFQLGRWHPRLNGFPLRLGIKVLVGGLVAVAGGQLLAALVAIERNTRQAGRNLDILWRSMQHH